VPTSNSNYDEVPAHLMKIKYITICVEKVAILNTALQAVPPTFWPNVYCGQTVTHLSYCGACFSNLEASTMSLEWVKLRLFCSYVVCFCYGRPM